MEKESHGELTEVDLVVVVVVYELKMKMPWGVVCKEWVHSYVNRLKKKGRIMHFTSFSVIIMTFVLYTIVSLCLFQCLTKVHSLYASISRVPDQNGVSPLYILCLRYTILVGNPRFQT